MASSKPIPCGPCQEGKINTKAEYWCYNCDEGLCSTCSCHHKRFKGTRDHKTIDIKSYKPSIQTIKTECDKHGQQLNLYCPSHLIPCCDKCISKNHSKCTGIKSLANVVEKTKIYQSKQSLEKQINSINHFLEKLVTNKSKNIARGEREYESIQDSVVKIRKEINCHLTNLEKKLCNEAETILNQVGHSFLLGTKYSEILGSTYKDKNAKNIVTQMGCYGLGVTRILQAGIEILSDDEAIRWPKIISPYQICIIPQMKGYMEDKFMEISNNLYDKLAAVPNLCGEVVIDDRTRFTVGNRLAQANRLGYPYVVVIGKSAIDEEPKFELQDIYNKTTDFLSSSQIISKLSHVKTT